MVLPSTALCCVLLGPGLRWGVVELGLGDTLRVSIVHVNFLNSNPGPAPGLLAVVTLICIHRTIQLVSIPCEVACGDMQGLARLKCIACLGTDDLEC